MMLSMVNPPPDLRGGDLVISGGENWGGEEAASGTNCGAEPGRGPPANGAPAKGKRG